MGCPYHPDWLGDEDECPKCLEEHKKKKRGNGARDERKRPRIGGETSGGPSPTLGEMIAPSPMTLGEMMAASSSTLPGPTMAPSLTPLEPMTFPSPSATLGPSVRADAPWAFKPFLHVVCDYHSPTGPLPRPPFLINPPALEGGTPLASIAPEGKKEHTYVRSDDSLHHGKEFTPYLNHSGPAANVGAYENHLGAPEFNVVAVGCRIDERSRWRGDGLLYNMLREYTLSRCKLLASGVNAAWDARDGESGVFVTNDYPCVIIDLTPHLLTQYMASHDGERKAFAEYMCFVLNGYLDYYAQLGGYSMACVCRSSFGFLTPTTAPLPESIRLNLGLAPSGYLACASTAIIHFLKDLKAVAARLDTIEVESSFFSSKEYVGYLAAKSGIGKKVAALPRRTPLATYMGRNISIKKGLFSEVTRVFENSAAATITSYRALHSRENGVLHAMVAPLTSGTWSVAKNTLSYSTATPKYTYPPGAIAPKGSGRGPCRDVAFRELLDALFKAAEVDVDAQVEVTEDGLWIAAIFAAEKIYLKGVETYLRLTRPATDAEGREDEDEDEDEDEEDGEFEDGSDSDEEEEGEDGDISRRLCSCKLISQGGMNAIGLSLVFAKAWLSPAPRTKTTIYAQQMYYERGHLLKVNTWLRESDAGTAEILMGDVNHCITSLEKKKAAPESTLIQNMTWSDACTIVIADVTSASLEAMGVLVNRFDAIAESPSAKGKVRALCFVDSGLKNQQSGTDKNPYGTLRFFVAKAHREDLTSTVGGVKGSRVYKPQPVVSHSVRRGFKVIGGVPTLSAIFAAARRLKGGEPSASSAPLPSSSSSPLPLDLLSQGRGVLPIDPSAPSIDHLQVFSEFVPHIGHPLTELNPYQSGALYKFFGGTDPSDQLVNLGNVTYKILCHQRERFTPTDYNPQGLKLALTVFERPG